MSTFPSHTPVSPSRCSPSHDRAHHTGCSGGAFPWAETLRKNLPLVREEYNALRKAGVESDYVVGEGEHTVRLPAPLPGVLPAACSQGGWWVEHVLTLRCACHWAVAQWEVGLVQLRDQG